MEISNIIWMRVLGAMVSSCVMYYNARFLGRLVRALIEIDATSPESALTLEELKLKMNPALKYSLNRGGSFSETVLVTDDGRYYIAPEKLDMAKSKYRGKDTTFLFLLLCLIGLLWLGFALEKLFPMAFSKAIGDFKFLFDTVGGDSF